MRKKIVWIMGAIIAMAIAGCGLLCLVWKKKTYIERGQENGE